MRICHRQDGPQDQAFIISSPSKILIIPFLFARACFVHSIGLGKGLSRAHGRISLHPRSSEGGIWNILSSRA